MPAKASSLPVDAVARPNLSDRNSEKADKEAIRKHAHRG
jgi:hypothetical protein